MDAIKYVEDLIKAAAGTPDAARTAGAMQALEDYDTVISCVVSVGAAPSMDSAHGCRRHATMGCLTHARAARVAAHRPPWAVEHM